MRKLKILNTKALEPAQVKKAEEHNILILEQEAIQIKPILSKEKWNEIFSLLEKKLTYAVFTSGNSVTTLKKYLNTYVNHLPQQWKVFCLSGKTKELLIQDEEIFGTIDGTAPNATALAQIIIGKGVDELLFFSGNRRRDELPSLLKAAGVQVHEVVVYETIVTPVAVGDEWDAVLFFSPSAVQGFFTANQLKADTVCFAIGDTTADSIKQFTPNRILISKEPSPEALLQEVFNYFKTA